MKVLILSTDDIKGGASKAAYALHRGLLRFGVESRLLVQKKYGDDYTVLAPERPVDKFWQQLVIPQIETCWRRLLFPRAKIFYSPAMVSSLDFKKIEKFNPDIINLHWFNRGFISIEDLKKINRPIVWTWHDVWPFCGGEHILTGDNIRYQEGYQSDNRPVGESGWDSHRFIWQRKKKSYAKLPQHQIITPSRWLKNHGEKSYLFKGEKIEAIPNGLDLSIYKPLAKAACRKILNLPLDKKIILFGANNGIANSYKGFSYLIEALGKLTNQSFYSELALTIFGCGKPANHITSGVPTYFLGRINNEQLLPVIYNAADLLVLPSLYDNLPNVVMESLACATPVVAFDTGGIKEMVEHQQNGYLAKYKDSADLATGISFIFGNQDNYQQLSQRARQKCEEEFSSELCAKRYLEIYGRILEDNR